MSLLQHWRGLKAAWAALPFTNKLIYGSFVFNGSLIMFLLLQESRSSRRSSQLWQEHMQQADKETNGWRCYELAKLLREQCHDETLLLLHLQDKSAAAVAAEQKGEAACATGRGEGEDKFCRRVLQGLKECKERLYEEIGDRIPPAMQPLPPVDNRPRWLVDPQWLQQQQQQQM
ncbi:uncharacterized protein LOC113146944 [Cyclospora cayetanensis]|uniref:Uncharacterized protein LOC113146944 n=1 Tax=Cyclospora cayetanensis TaxID=88456 RepID=A0A6P6RWS5_9EIME|nr:uncharacterized protein LOC113146944 [Cyclospora cayetanensis]